MMVNSHSIQFDGIFNGLLRTLMLIAFGLANINNGLTSYVPRNHLNDDQQQQQHQQLHEERRNINQNLIMSASSDPALLFSPKSTDGFVIPGSQSLNPSPEASSLSLSPSASFYPSSSSSSSSSSATSSFPAFTSFPSSSSSFISASSSLYQRTSGSSIKSFDSTNVLTPLEQQYQQQQQQQSATARQQRQRLSAVSQNVQQTPLHKAIGLGGMTVAGVGMRAGSSQANNGGLQENLLIDTNTSGDGTEDELYTAPMYFATENSTMVTTQIGATAHIPCTIHHIGDGVVSWIRKKDYHLLTVGLTTYSSDERFSATHLKHSEDWTLQIKFVQLRDAGVYECQVSTHPPTSIFLHLNVVEARAEITGPPIRYLTPGSTLRLQCRVVQNTEASEFIFWYHDNRMINYDIDRGINVSTEPDFQSSELTILRTRREHSGNFTCVASNTQPASVLVHIFKGDNPAAMYHGHVGSSTKSYQTHLPSIMLIITTGYRIFCSRIHIKIV